MPYPGRRFRIRTLSCVFSDSPKLYSAKQPRSAKMSEFSATWPRKWVAITEPEIDTSPYAAVCEIGVDGNVVGTGWLAASRVVVTAAHVLGGASACEVKFPSWKSSRRVAIPRTEIGGSVLSPGSPSDIACIALPESISTITPLSIAVPRTVVSVVALGYFNGTLLRSEGSGEMFGDEFVAHNADTHPDGGQSGGPLLFEGGVVAIHLGSSSISRKFVASHYRKSFDNYMNSGVLIGESIKRFIQEIMEESDE